MPPTSREFFFFQVEKLVNSSVLKGSESLCKLLHYLAERSIDHPGEPIKEYQIATEVFGKNADFDPRLDATVRVQSSRLRAKLAEYYAAEGAEDQVILDIPRGSYALAVHPRAGVAGASVHTASSPRGEPVSRAVPGVKPPVAAFWVLSALCIGLLAALVYLVPKRQVAQVAAAPAVPRVFSTFWHGFVDRPEPPLVVFSNAEFVGRPETGMRYFDSSRDSRASILDHYTGVGEVLGIHELDRVFTLLNHAIRVKRGRLLSLDDAENTNLIFVGSPSENLALREIPTTQDFVFRLAPGGPRKGDLEIANLHPRSGEQKAYMGSKSVPISEDHALIGLVPSRNSGRWVLILAGTTTIGTQAAVEYVCRERDLRELVTKVGTSAAGAVLPFESVIHVKVIGGVPVSTEVVALHPRPSA